MPPFANFGTEPWFSEFMKFEPYFCTELFLMTNSPPVKSAGTSSFTPDPPLIIPPLAFLWNNPKIPPPPPPTILSTACFM